MKKQAIKINESQLAQIVRESVKNVLKESSYDNLGNFDATSHNNELRDRLKQEVEKIDKFHSDTLFALSHIQTSTTDNEISERARIIINAILAANRMMGEVTSLIRAGR